MVEQRMTLGKINSCEGFNVSLSNFEGLGLILVTYKKVYFNRLVEWWPSLLLETLIFH